MPDTQIQNLKTDIIAIGRLLWEKELATGLSGNISARVDADRILLTATKTCLGLLHEKDILLMKISGEILDEGQVSTERLLHTEIYKNFPDVQSVIHTHTAYINAYFVANDVLTPRIFESRVVLGEVKSVPQTTPSVTDATPVIGALKSNNIMVLKNHGVVAMGKDLFDCFLLIQCLEDAVKIDAISRLYHQPSAAAPSAVTGKTTKKITKTTASKKFKLFSKEQIDEIVRVVNADRQMRDLGAQTKMTMDLAVKLEGNGKVYCFKFDNGRISKVTHDENAEFLITAPETIWRAVFNREIDPFVATTQKKMNLRGDFARISKWYAPCSRIFELWAQVPVE